MTNPKYLLVSIPADAKDLLRELAAFGAKLKGLSLETGFVLGPKKSVGHTRGARYVSRFRIDSEDADAGKLFNWCISHPGAEMLQTESQGAVTL